MRSLGDVAAAVGVVAAVGVAAGGVVAWQTTTTPHDHQIGL